MSTSEINRTIRHLGVEIVRGYGYVYFCSLADGGQVGESVMIPFLNRCSLEQWMAEAKFAVENPAS